MDRRQAVDALVKVRAAGDSGLALESMLIYVDMRPLLFVMSGPGQASAEQPVWLRVKSSLETSPGAVRRPHPLSLSHPLVLREHHVTRRAQSPTILLRPLAIALTHSVRKQCFPVSGIREHTAFSRPVLFVVAARSIAIRIVIITARSFQGIPPFFVEPFSSVLAFPLYPSFVFKVIVWTGRIIGLQGIPQDDCWSIFLL